VRKYYFIWLLLCVPFFVSGQIYGNEWINYSQKYYKIKVINDGVYRIDSLVLAQAGISLSGLDPRHFQIFFQGKEQYIYVQGESDGVFSKNDYIEFYGKHNDGTLDSLVYTGITRTPNPYYSMFNDTSTYYLTWNNSTSNHRLTMETNSASGFGSYTPVNYFIAQNVNFGNSQYYEGARIQVPPETVSDPRYSRAEGWFFPELDLNNSQTYNLNISNAYTSGPPAFISTMFLGESTAGTTPDHEMQIFSSWGGSNPLIDTTFSDDFPQIVRNFSAPASQLNGATMTFSSVSNQISWISAVGNTTAISYIYTQYPHDTNMGGASTYMMYLPNSGPSNTFVDLINFSASAGDTVRFYDFTDHYRLKVYQSGSTVRVLVPNPSPGNNNRQCYITSDNQVNYVTKLIPAGNAGVFTSFVPSSRTLPPYIIITHPSLWTEASAYAAYRSMKYDVILANVEELYDQFGYGVEKDPLGIKRFCNYAVNNWRIPPADLFLMGKGIHTPLYRQTPSAYIDCLVPSFGYPSSDILFSDFTPNSLRPAIATGRLAAVTGTDVSNYLAKVETYESNPPALWQKRIIHFGGGSSAAEQSQFLSYLNGYAAIAKSPLLGANIYTFQKTSPNPIQITIADSVTNLINTGVSIMTFFGHADGSNFDVSLDAPNDYNNIGKYPVIIANACFSGDIFQPSGQAVSSTSEQFVLYPNGGAIAFLAADDLGVAGELYNYTSQLYTDFSSVMYRKPLSNCIQSTINSVQTTSDPLEEYTCMEMTLHGDPAITINAPDSLPDYAVTDSSIYFTPSNVTTQLDSFSVHIIVSNIGEAVLNQAVQLSLTRYLPAGSTATYYTTFTHLYYQDTAVIKIPVNVVSGVGLNRFYVNVDPSNLIHELTKTNNQIGPNGFPPATNLLITSGDITPVFPYQFAIIPGDTTTLKASTGNPNAPLGKYIFQIDTSGNFNSPWLKSQVVYAYGGVVNAPSEDWVNTPPSPLPINPGGGGTNPNTGTQRILNVGHTTTDIGAPNGASQNAAGNVSNETHSAPIQNNAVQNSISAVHSSATMAAPQINGVRNGTSSIYSSATSSKIKGISSQTIMGNNRIKSGGPPLLLIDTMVYYWRVRRDTTDVKDYQWQSSSFQYIKGKTGWAQANYYQFINDQYQYINTNPAQRSWSFTPTGKTLLCYTSGVPPAALYTNAGFLEYEGRLAQTEYKLDLTIQAAGGCQIYPALSVAIIDPVSLQPWSNSTYNLGNANNAGVNGGPPPCTYPDKRFIYWESVPSQMNSLFNLLQSNAPPPVGVPNGNYILIYSWTEGNFSAWANPSLRGELVTLGASPALLTCSDTVPFIFFVQKGNPSTAITLIGRNSNDSLQLITNLTNNEDFGSITTPLIGPAQKFDSISWSQHLLPGSSIHDSIRLNIIGVDQYGNQHTLVSGITPAVANMYISSISTTQYPCLQLNLYTQDVITHKPSQMRKWQVFYTPVPEVAVNPSVYTYFHKDTLQVGDSIYYKTVVQNISSYPIDSMVYNTWLVDAGNALHYLPVKHTKKLNPGDTTMLTVKASSAGYFGHNSVWFEVNPQFELLTRPEEYHFNDIVQEYFYVAPDKTNPLLDVTFDGIHIMNNDIVSAHPSIVMQVMDENKFLALNDTSDFAVFIRNTNIQTAQRVYFGSAAHPNPQLNFTPAVLPNNSCRILYTPALQDGTYELTVQATDRSGNFSGGSSNNYIIDFQVINKPMISNVLNYPNPFSTSTRFVFTLTGSEVPTYFKVQIMTITGKVVKEITEAEIGPLHIGNNITTYAWDGTDQFGDKLANGIYLYRIVTTLDGQAVEHYSTSADQYFTQGWGKMYLIR